MKKTTKTTTKNLIYSVFFKNLFIFSKLKCWSQNILPSFSCWHLTPFFQNTVLRNLFKMTFFFLWNMFLSLSFEKVVLLSKNWEEVCVRFQSERQQPQWVVIVKNLYISKIIKRILTFGERKKRSCGVCCLQYCNLQ